MLELNLAGLLLWHIRPALEANDPMSLEVAEVRRANAEIDYSLSIH